MKKSNVAAQERADTTDASTGQPDSRNRITNKDDAIIEENLWQAAGDGLDDDAVADLLLRHRDGVVCNGLDDHVGLKREVATDGGVSRRKFLGTAAAATAGVPIVSGEGSAESPTRSTNRPT